VSRPIVEGIIVLGGFDSGRANSRRSLKYRITPVLSAYPDGIALSITSGTYHVGAIASQTELKRLIADLTQFVVEDNEGNE
jgi:hypothetical protein